MTNQLFKVALLSLLGTISAVQQADANSWLQPCPPGQGCSVPKVINTVRECYEIYGGNLVRHDDVIQSRSIVVATDAKSIEMDCWITFAKQQTAPTRKLTPDGRKDKLTCPEGYKAVRKDPNNGECVLQPVQDSGTSSKSKTCTSKKYTAPFPGTVRMFATAARGYHTGQGYVQPGDVVIATDAHLEGTNDGNQGEIIAHYAEYVELPALPGDIFHGCATFASGVSANLHLF